MYMKNSIMNKIALSLEKKAKLASIFISITLLIVAYLSKDIGVMGNSILLSSLLIIFVFSFFEYKKYREFKEMEEKFPLFLRDLRETINKGVSLSRAIVLLSKYDYGSLNEEIKKMANQISWHIPLNKVLERAAERMKRSKRISMALKILREAHMSGGNTNAVLTSLSESFETLEEIGKERKSLLNQYVLMIYAISLIFLAVIIVLQRILLPILSKPEMFEGGMTSPCLSCFEVECIICDFYRFTAFSIFAAKEENFYYIAVFFYLSVVQAFFAGLVAGQIAEGSIKAGLKHSLILVSIAIGILLLLSRIGVIGV